MNKFLSKRRWLRQSFSAATLVFALAWTGASAMATEIIVSAAASLTDVLKEIGSGYQSSSKHTVRFNLGASSSLARQIEAGAPADLFFSADLAQMNVLDKNGRLEPGTQKNLLSNQLVIIAPADSKLSYRRLKTY
jgi:molybdate transport system substrate-binding protein